MIIHRISHTDNQLRTTEQDAQAVAAVVIGGQRLLDAIAAGCCIFSDGCWIFGQDIWTKDGVRPVSELRIVALLSPKSGAPGSCDLHTIEAWDGETRVMNSGNVVAEGIDVLIPSAAGQVGGPALSLVPPLAH
jgi:hypothetical protein